MGRTLILGIGNLLLTDDGVGVHTLRRLQQMPGIPADVQLIDGGTCGLDLLQYVANLDRLIIIDAGKIGSTPGKITRITGDKVPAYLSLKTSPHEIGLPELLFAAKLTNVYPKEVVIYCMEAASLETGIELTPALSKNLDNLVSLVVNEVA
jgi:hydrogenase maturation protease